MNLYHISIEGMSDPKSFVSEWSKVYEYKSEYKYTNNIHRGFETDETLTELMRWKNGTGENFSERKTKPIEFFKSKRHLLSGLQKNFSFSEFEEEFQPETNSSIWKIFLLHIINPDNHPIFDQHVYRSYRFFKTGEIEELSSTNHKMVYNIYKNEYLPWFNELKVRHNLEPRMIDMSFFSFGRFLKSMKGKPYKVINPN